MSDLNNPHDKLFKETFSYQEVVIDFISYYIPQEISAIIDVNTIQPLKDSYIQKELAEHYSDLLFQVSIGDRPGFVYFLFEHKSYPENTIAFQLLRYMLEIWQREFDKENVKELPVILPIIIYQGKQKWETPKTIMDWLGGSDRVELELRKFIPYFEMLHFDFSENSDIDIHGTAKLKAYLQLIKHIYTEDLEKLYSIIVQLDQAEELHYFETVIIYILNLNETISTESIKERLTLEGRKKLMTAAEKLRQEGMQKGIHEGVKRVARNLLMQNVDEDIVMKTTELTKQEIDEIRRTLK